MFCVYIYVVVAFAVYMGHVYIVLFDIVVDGVIYMRVCIEGVMGAGKSTFLDYVSTDYVREPLLGGTGIGFRRELEYLLARNDAWHNLGSGSTDSVQYFDRSVWSSGIFWWPEYTYHKISYDELELLNTTRDALLRDVDLPDLIVYLDLPVRVAVKRVNLRGDFDSNVEHDYIRKLEASYAEFLVRMNKLGVPIIRVDAELDVYGEERIQYCADICDKIDAKLYPHNSKLLSLHGQKLLKSQERL